MPERRASPARRHPLHLPVTTLPQPDETTCGPTCLHAVYRYWGDDEPLQTVIERMWRLEHGGTYAVFLGCDALRKGYRARIYTYNITVFDPTWFTQPHIDIAAAACSTARAASATRASSTRPDGYLEFLRLGGRLRLRDLSPAPDRRHPALPAADPHRPVVDVSVPLGARSSTTTARPTTSAATRSDISSSSPAGTTRGGACWSSIRTSRIRTGRRTNTGSASTACSRRSCSASSRTTPTCSSSIRANGTPVEMNILFVVNHRARLAVEHRGARVVTAREYLTDPRVQRTRRRASSTCAVPTLPGPRLLRVAARRGARPPPAAGGEDDRRPAGASTSTGCSAASSSSSCSARCGEWRRCRAPSMHGSAATRSGATTRSRSSCSRPCGSR